MKKYKYQIRRERDNRYLCLYKGERRMFFWMGWRFMELSPSLAKLIESAAEDAKDLPEYEVIWSSEILAGQK